jgi:hypothetical protein
MCAQLETGILERAGAPPEFVSEFSRHFRSQVDVWAEAWGYATAELTEPERGFANTADLVTHCLKIHCREICFRLLVDERLADGQGGFEQSPEDMEAVRTLLRALERARRLAAAACAEHGVEA